MTEARGGIVIPITTRNKEELLREIDQITGEVRRKLDSLNAAAGPATAGLRGVGDQAQLIEGRFKSGVRAINDARGALELLGVSTGPVGRGIGALTAVVANLGDAFGVLGAIATRNPIGLIAIAVAGAAAAYLTLRDNTEHAAKAQVSYQVAIEKAAEFTQTAAERARALAEAKRAEATETVNAAIAAEREIQTKAAAAAQRASGVVDRLEAAKAGGANVDSGLERARATLEGINQAAADSQGRLGHLQQALEGVRTFAEPAADALAGVARAAEDGRDPLEKYISTLRTETEALGESNRERDIRAALDKAIALEMERGNLLTKEAADTIRELINAKHDYIDATAAQVRAEREAQRAQEEAARAAERYLRDVERNTDRVLDNLSRAGGDVLFDAWKGESRDLWQSFQDYGMRAIANLAAEAATNAIFRPFVSGFVQSAPGLFGINVPAGGAPSSGGGFNLGGLLDFGKMFSPSQTPGGGIGGGFNFGNLNPFNWFGGGNGGLNFTNLIPSWITSGSGSPILAGSSFMGPGGLSIGGGAASSLGEMAFATGPGGLLAGGGATSLAGAGFATGPGGLLAGGGVTSGGAGAAAGAGGLSFLGPAGLGFGIGMLSNMLFKGNRTAGIIGGGVGGGIAGGALAGTAIFPGVGTAVGAVVGAIAGMLGASLGGKPSVGPNANANLVLSRGQFGVGASAADNGGNVGQAIQTTTAIAQALNTVTKAYGLKAAGSGFQLDAGYFKDQLYIGAGGGPGVNMLTQTNDADALALAAFRQLYGRGNIAGGSPSIAGVINSSNATSLSALSSDLDLAKMIDELLGNTDPLATALGDINSKFDGMISRAKELGLAYGKLEEVRDRELEAAKAMLGGAAPGMSAEGIGTLRGLVDAFTVGGLSGDLTGEQRYFATASRYNAARQRALEERSPAAAAEFTQAAAIYFPTLREYEGTSERYGREKAVAISTALALGGDGTDPSGAGRAIVDATFGSASMIVDQLREGNSEIVELRRAVDRYQASIDAVLRKLAKAA